MRKKIFTIVLLALISSIMFLSQINLGESSSQFEDNYLTFSADFTTANTYEQTSLLDSSIDNDDEFEYQESSGWWSTSYGYYADNVDNRMVSGDFNGDGKSDIAAFYDSGSGAARLHVWLSTGEGLIFQGSISTGWWSSSGYYLSCVANRIVAGDFDGDGKDDIATLYDYGSGAARIHVWLSTGTGFSYSGSAGWWNTPSGSYSLDKVANRMVAGDFNGDGKDDIVTFFDNGGGSATLHFLESTGSSFNYPTSWWSSNGYYLSSVADRIVAGDFDGDGKDDIATFYNYGVNAARIHIWCSTSYSFNYQGSTGWWSTPDEYSLSNIDNRMVAGDFNGDDIDDVATFYDTGSGLCQIHTWISVSDMFVYHGSSGWWMSSSGYYLSSVADRMVAGDIDGDGYYDIATLYDYGGFGSARIHTWLSASNCEKIAIFFWSTSAGTESAINQYIDDLKEEDYTKFYKFKDCSDVLSACQTIDDYECSGDIIFVYIIGHGNNDGSHSYTKFSPSGYSIYSNIFRGYMDNWEATRKCILVESCHSGDWVDDFAGNNYLAMSTSDEYHDSYPLFNYLPCEGKFSNYFFNRVDSGYNAEDSFYYAKGYVTNPAQYPKISEIPTHIWFG